MHELAQSAKVRVLAVATDKRLESLPEVSQMWGEVIQAAGVPMQ